MKPKVDEWVESVQTLGKSIEVSQNGIWWYCNVTPIIMSITSEKHPKFRIGYGYDMEAFM